MDKEKPLDRVCNAIRRNRYSLYSREAYVK